MYLAAPVGQMRGIVPPGAWGPCRSDSACLDDPNTYVSFLKDRGFIKYTRTAGQGLFVDGDTTITMFTKGQDQEDTGAGWPTGVAKSTSDTNLFNDGTPTDDDTKCFEVWGMQVDVFNPIVWTDRGVAPLGQTQESPAWLAQYEDKLVERTLETWGITFTHGYKKCQWDFGNLSDWPKNEGPVGPNQTTGGARAATGVYIPFARSNYVPGGNNAANQLKVFIRSPKNYRVGVLEQSTASVSDVWMPVEVKLCGRMTDKACKNGPVCIPDGMTQEQAQAILMGGLTSAELEMVAKQRAANGG